jgi:uncharacterized protein (TIGR02145 family)
MRKIIYFISSFIIIINISCKKDDVNNANFELKELKHLTHNSIIVHAEVNGTDSPFDVWEKGICYSISSNPDLNDNLVKDISGTGQFYSSISGLSPSTTYYIRVYTKTEDGIFFSSQQSFKTLDVNYLTDSRDEQKYPIINIGSQSWFATNLNYKTSEGSFYFQNDSITYASEFGRLYSYEAALEACPAGWHVPTDDEWKALEIELGMLPISSDSLAWRGSIAGNKMKEPGSRLWYYDSEELATNESGLTIKPSGSYNIATQEYSEPSLTAFFWTSTLSGSEAYARLLQANDGKILRGTVNKNNLAFSIRCVKD